MTIPVQIYSGTPVYEHPWNEDICLNQEAVCGPNYVEMCTKSQLKINEDASFNQDTLGCPKGVWNREVPLYMYTCMWMYVYVAGFERKGTFSA